MYGKDNATLRGARQIIQGLRETIGLETAQGGRSGTGRARTEKHPDVGEDASASAPALVASARKWRSMAFCCRATDFIPCRRRMWPTYVSTVGTWTSEALSTTTLKN